MKIPTNSPSPLEGEGKGRGGTTRHPHPFSRKGRRERAERVKREFVRLGRGQGVREETA